MPQITVNNQVVIFQEKSLSRHVAGKLLKAITAAYIRSCSISCSTYTPNENTERGWYIATCQLVHDNCENVQDANFVRNLCMEKLLA